MTLEQAKKLAKAILKGRGQYKNQEAYLANMFWMLSGSAPFNAAYCDAASSRGAAKEPNMLVIQLAKNAFPFKGKRHRDISDVAATLKALAGSKMTAVDIYRYMYGEDPDRWEALSFCWCVKKAGGKPDKSTSPYTFQL